MDPADLRNHPLFAGLDDEALVDVAAQFERQEVPVGSILAREGDFAYRFFCVLTGTASITRDGEHLAHVSAGGFVGETGILANERRNAMVVATSDMTLASLVGWDFREMCERHPSLKAAIDAVVAQRS